MACHSSGLPGRFLDERASDCRRLVFTAKVLSRKAAPAQSALPTLGQGTGSVRCHPPCWAHCAPTSTHGHFFLRPSCPGLPWVCPPCLPLSPPALLLPFLLPFPDSCPCLAGGLRAVLPPWRQEAPGAPRYPRCGRRLSLGASPSQGPGEPCVADGLLERSSWAETREAAGYKSRPGQAPVSAEWARAALSLGPREPSGRAMARKNSVRGSELEEGRRAGTPRDTKRAGVAGPAGGWS